MVNKNQLLGRLIALAAILLLCTALVSLRLVSLQLVDGEQYVKKAAVNLTTTSTVSAARGEILDRYGRPLVTNKTIFSLVLVYSAWEQEEQFDRILELCNMVKADGGKIDDILPITEQAPYAFVGKPDDAERKTLTKYMQDSEKKIGVGAEAAAPAFLKAMRTYLELPENYSDADARQIIGVYYSMRQRGFNIRTSFTLATEVSIDLIAVIKENHKKYAGVEVETQSVRQYNTKSAAHLLGRVGPMYEADWEKFKSRDGYNMNDQIGKAGIEAALEQYLHGKAGSRTVETGLGGETVGAQTEGYAPEPGNNCILTIDLDLQQAAEQSLADNIAQYGAGGAAVVMDVHSGEVLAMASYPTYDLENYNRDYAQIESDGRKPELNRATNGQYAPGSTFKILTAVAALEEGQINANTTYVCTGKFEYGGQTFKCNNLDGHGAMTVTDAIKYSCNVYFYEVGKELTGAKLEKWCDKFGMGKLTGVEIGEESGQAAGPTSRAAMRQNDPTLRDWQGGDDVQAAIGQSDSWFTPLQMANYMSAVVNGGTLYQPTLVKNIKSYDYGTVIKEEKPEIANTIQMSPETLQLVMTGMGEVTAEGGTAAQIFSEYSLKIGGKTGTAQTNNPDLANGVFIAFGPFSDPEIAICVVGEAAQHGSSVAPVVRDIFDAYTKTADDTVEILQTENVLIS